MFPLNHSFQEEGWCSQNTGYAKVNFIRYFRLLTIVIPLFLSKSYKTELL